MPDKLTELLLSGDSPVVGPNTAAQLQAFAEEPEPSPPTQDQVDTLVGKLALATAQARVSDAEAAARLEMYWLALRDLPIEDLRGGFIDLLRNSTFMPTPAEVRSAAIRKGALRRYAKSRARHLVWKHGQEWKPAAETVDPEELRALMAANPLGRDAQADRSAKRQDPQGLGPEDESPVPAEQGCAQSQTEAS